MSARSGAPDEVVWFEASAGVSSAGVSSAGVSSAGASSAGRSMPQRFPSPFAVPPHPIARHAAELLVADLRAGRLGIDPRMLDTPASEDDPSTGGKMFGVLVVHVDEPDHIGATSARSSRAIDSLDLGTIGEGRGRFGYLRAFSGMLAGAWSLPGFVPPLFDTAARDAMWPQGQATLRAYEIELRELLASAAYTSAKAHLASFDRELVKDLAFLQERHRERRAARKLARARHEPHIDGVCLDESPRATESREAALHALDQESRGDTAERKRFDTERAAERAAILARLEPLEARRTELERLRADESRGLMKQVHDHYSITNARGERRPLRALFSPREPPGGAGDCAAPKLLGFAYAHDLTPIALAEVWIGAQPATGGRHDAAFYAACRGKCGPILPFMLEGLDHDPFVDPGSVETRHGPTFPVSGPRTIEGASRSLPRGAAGSEASAPTHRESLPSGASSTSRDASLELARPDASHSSAPTIAGLAEPSASTASTLPPVVFEDEHLVIVNKPVGMLSVPGRSGALRDSVQTRLRALYPAGSVVHRLDLDTSGLLLCAKTLAAYKSLQAMFARREIAKRYVAIVDGDVLADEGTIELPLRVDLDDRPRQIVDDEHGKPAMTTWRVLARHAFGRDAGSIHTRIELVPLTGRTHQLRVHCAHRFGLDAPIVGDRLYGTPASQHAPRLLLHAERLVFTHPIFGGRVDATSPAPF
jgi:tRNA pseudouridine32 synthase/23S rRNA pseudouridine746 synthase